MTVKNRDVIYGGRTLLMFVLICFAALCAVPAGVYAAPAIAVIDMLRVVNSHPDMSLNRKMLEKQVAEFDAEQRGMQVKLDVLKKELDVAMEELQDPKLAEADRGAKMKQAQNKMVAFKECEQKKRETAELRQNQLSDEGTRMRQQLEIKIRCMVKDYAKKNDFILVLDLSSIGGSGLGTVVYSVETVDITGKILKIIDPSRAE